MLPQITFFAATLGAALASFTATLGAALTLGAAFILGAGLGLIAAFAFGAAFIALGACLQVRCVVREHAQHQHSFIFRRGQTRLA